MADMVNHPPHYRFSNGVEPVDIAEWLSFNLGNVVKYVSRAGCKGDAVEDLLKARFYLEREISRLESMDKIESTFGEVVARV